MSILKALGIRSMVASFLEVGLFFLVITPLYFSAVAAIYALVARQGGQLDWSMTLLPLAPASLGRWGGILPVWMWAMELLGYLLLVTIYWAPGEQGLNRAELGGLVIFLIVTAVGSLAWVNYRYGAVGNAVTTFWRIVTGHMVGGS
jgi:hypothetical protein